MKEVPVFSAFLLGVIGFMIMKEWVLLVALLIALIELLVQHKAKHEKTNLN